MFHYNKNIATKHHSSVPRPYVSVIETPQSRNRDVSYYNQQHAGKILSGDPGQLLGSTPSHSAQGIVKLKSASHRSIQITEQSDRGNNIASSSSVLSSTKNKREAAAREPQQAGSFKHYRDYDSKGKSVASRTANYLKEAASVRTDMSRLCDDPEENRKRIAERQKVAKHEFGWAQRK